MSKTIKETAARLYDTLAPWERYDTTPEEIAEQIEKDPAAVINYLLDTLGIP